MNECFSKHTELGWVRKMTQSRVMQLRLGNTLLETKLLSISPGIMGSFHDKQVEMLRVFGTRWLPFGKEIGKTTAPAKGLGIHGAPWDFDRKQERWIEARHVIGQYDSDGCIRMAFEDIEELFAIVITRPTVIEIVKNFKEAKLPGVEVTVLKDSK